MKSQITQIERGEFVSNPDRVFFSYYCSKTSHSNCKGHVSKSRNPTGICECTCHKIKGDAL